MCVLFCEFCIHSKRVQQKWNFWQVIPILIFGSHIFPKAQGDLKQNGTQLRSQFLVHFFTPFLHDAIYFIAIVSRHVIKIEMNASFLPHKNF